MKYHFRCMVYSRRILTRAYMWDAWIEPIDKEWDKMHPEPDGISVSLGWNFLNLNGMISKDDLMHDFRVEFLYDRVWHACAQLRWDRILKTHGKF